MKHRYLISIMDPSTNVVHIGHTCSSTKQIRLLRSSQHTQLKYVKCQIQSKTSLRTIINITKPLDALTENANTKWCKLMHFMNRTRQRCGHDLKRTRTLRLAQATILKKTLPLRFRNPPPLSRDLFNRLPLDHGKKEERYRSTQP